MKLIDTDKYCWHDLRGNPEDLPDDCSGVIVAINWFGQEQYTVCDYEDELFQDHINPALGFQKYITAWRYIEPFEVNT